MFQMQFLVRQMQKNGISRWCWLKVFGTQFEEWIYAISNAGNEARMSFSHLLKQSREFHRMNKMNFQNRQNVHVKFKFRNAFATPEIT